MTRRGRFCAACDASHGARIHKSCGACHLCLKVTFCVGFGAFPGLHPQVGEGEERRGHSVDAELLQLVAQRAEGDAQLRGGLGLVVTVVLQRLFDGLALDFLDEAGQGAAGGFSSMR